MTTAHVGTPRGRREGAAPAEARTSSGGRLAFLDWLRGIAVVIMIEAHTIDAWTRPADREDPWFRHALLVGGFGAPLFLFLAGVAAVLSAGAKARRQGVRAAAAAVRRRGWEIFALAFLFRLQAFLLNPGSQASGLLKVDILNVMGPSIVLAAAIWQAARSGRGVPESGDRRAVAPVIAFSLATVAVAMATPVVRAAPWLDGVPDPVEWYLRPAEGRTNFVMFPWAAFVFGGGAVGAILEAARGASGERRAMAGLACAGLAVAAAGYGASLLPPVYAATSFWTSSPTFFFVRLGLLVAAVGAAWLWTRARGDGRWSPIGQLGRTSLFIYWIHVEIVYGILSWPLHRALPLGGALAGFVLFTLLMLGASLLKDRLVARRAAARAWL